MSQPPTRTVNSVSPQEIARRHNAVRARMRELDLDALIVQNSSDWVGGYIRWFTNQPATNGYPTSLVFSVRGDVTRIEQGPFDATRSSSDSEILLTGVTNTLTTPSYPSVGYTGTYDAALVVRELRRMGAARVGLVGPAGMYHTFGKHVENTMSAGAVVDATDFVDRLKAIKSPEERDLIRSVAAMQDQVLRRVAEFIRPGLRDFEIAAYAQYVGQQLGSEQGIFLCSSAPPGEAASFLPRSMQGRTLASGDVFSLLIENNGAGGYYTELSRIFVLGRATEQLRQAHAQVLDAQRYGLSLLVPGANCREVYSRHNAYLCESGLQPERRLSIHGMGYDMVERPLIRDDEEMTIEEHMILVCHPGISNDQMFVHNTDVYLVQQMGPSQSLHSTPQEIFEIT